MQRTYNELFKGKLSLNVNRRGLSFFLGTVSLSVLGPIQLNPSRLWCMCGPRPSQCSSTTRTVPLSVGLHIHYTLLPSQNTNHSTTFSPLSQQTLSAWEKSLDDVVCGGVVLRWKEKGGPQRRGLVYCRRREAVAGELSSATFISSNRLSFLGIINTSFPIRSPPAADGFENLNASGKREREAVIYFASIPSRRQRIHEFLLRTTSSQYRWW